MSSLTSNLYKFGEFSLDPQSRVLRRGGTTVPLTPKGFDLLLLLIQNTGRIVTKDELMKAVWRDSFVEESNLTQTIFMVRKALDETVDRRFILTVQGQGYRFLVPVTESEASSTVEAVAAVPKAEPQVVPRAVVGTTDVGTTSGGGGFSRWRLALLGIAALFIGALGIYWVTLRWRATTPSASERPMLAILPFTNLTGDAAQEYFSDGLTEEMISQLGNLDPQHLGVIARTSVMHYKNGQTPLSQIGHELGVQYVLEGSVRRDAGRVRITAQLIQMSDQSHLWAREYDRELRDLLALQSEIAQGIADEIHLTLSDRHPSEVKRATAAASYEAYDLYLKGRYFWNKRTGDGFRQAANYFQEAISKDPNYARAYAGLADTYGLMSTWYQVPQNEFMPKARAAALRALAIDESLAEAHASLGLIAENYDYDWAGAEKEFRRTIELDPQYATGHQWYAEYLAWQGRFEEAFAESNRARQLDPMSPIIATDHAVILYYSRQYDQAIEQCRGVLEMDPGFEHARAIIMGSYVQEKKFAEAAEEIDRELSADSPWNWATKTYVYGKWGRREETERALARFEKVTQGSRANWTPAALYIYMGTGRKDQAMALLERAYVEHSNAVVGLKVDPMYDPLRGDPRFQELLRKLGLGP